jgi:hypothetical protein
MNPANLPCLLAAGIDCCVLANNHVRQPGDLVVVSLHWGGNWAIEFRPRTAPLPVPWSRPAAASCCMGTRRITRWASR